VLEGPSAVGKTTWCREHAPGYVKAAPSSLDAPDLFADPIDVANFWVPFNSGLWESALQIERREGMAVCDSDPLHLYFSFSLWKAGAIDRRLFDAEVRLYRRAMARHRIGFADFVLWQCVPLEELRRRAKADAEHHRRRHELYVSLIPWMKLWFEARERVLPGSLGGWPPVQGLQPERVGNARTASRRYDVATFDRLIQDLAGCQPSGL
jgi:hypothetical protein